MENQPFDFKKYNVDPSTVLRNIWSDLQTGLSKQEVTRLNAIFVKEYIFHPNEIEECCNSQQFVQLLSKRSDPQHIATAINIICSERVHQGIKAIVQKDFPTLPSSESPLVKIPNQRKMDDPVSKENIGIIIEAIYTDGTLFTNWPTLAYELGLDTNFVKPLRVKVFGDLIDFRQLLRSVIEEWVRLNTGATVADFCKVLRAVEFMYCEGQVTAAFRTR